MRINTIGSVLGIILTLLVFIGGCFCGHRLAKGKKIVEIQRDTTYIHDTTRIESPPEIKYVKTTDTLLVRVTDTLMIHDTTYLVLHKEEKEYRGEDYYAKVSGYRPSLDVIEVYPKTTIIRESRNNYISLGMSASYMNGFSIPIYLEYERMLQRNFKIHGRFLRDLKTSRNGAEIGGSIIFGW